MINMRRPRLTLSPREGPLSGDRPGLPSPPLRWPLLCWPLPPFSVQTGIPADVHVQLEDSVHKDPPELTFRRKASKVLFCPSHLYFYLFGILLLTFIFFLKILFINERYIERGRERKAGFMQAARRGTRSWDSRIMPWAKGRHQTPEPPRDPLLSCVYIEEPLLRW